MILKQLFYGIIKKTDVLSASANLVAKTIVKK
jgi:hypothetical protein